MGMNFTSLVIGVIIVSMLALGLGSFMADLSSTYGVPMNQTYVNTYAKLNEISNITNNINDQVISDSTSTGDVAETLLSQGGASIKLSLSGIGLIGAMLQDASGELGLPSWFVGGILGIIIVSLAFLAITVLTKAFKSL